MKNRKKIGIAALASLLSIAITGGTLVPVYAATQRREYKTCEYCKRVCFKEDIENHKKDCLKNPNNPNNPNYGQCKFCGVKIETQMDVFYYGNISYHEKSCEENPDRVRPNYNDNSKEDIEISFDIPEDGDEEEITENSDTSTVEIENSILPLADDNSKEDIEIDFDIPEECPFCKETFNKSELEEHEKVCPQNPENQKPVEPEKPTDTTKEPNNNSKEEIEWDVDDLYCPNCGEFSMGYHECKNNYFDVESGDPNSKEDIEIEIPLNDNTEQIAILETEVIEAERIASEARAEADRLTAIATEKRAALEALRQ